MGAKFSVFPAKEANRESVALCLATFGDGTVFCKSSPTQPAPGAVYAVLKSLTEMHEDDRLLYVSAKDRLIVNILKSYPHALWCEPDVTESCFGSKRNPGWTRVYLRAK